jgi:hypothetical protein
VDLSAGRTVSSEKLYIFEATGTPPTAMTLSPNPPAPLERNRLLIAEAVLLLGVISALLRPTGTAPIAPSPVRRSSGLQA